MEQHSSRERLVKIGYVELPEGEALKLYEAGKYIVTCGAVYQLFFSRNAGVYGQAVYHKQKGGPGFVRRGRFLALDARGANNLIGFTLLGEDNI